EYLDREKVRFAMNMLKIIFEIILILFIWC
ncbi:unnamed protein product, partial [marine sediment metagenome]